MNATDTAADPDLRCGVFNRVQTALDPNVIHRFLVGQDAAPVVLSNEEAGAELGDPIATLLLLQGKFPETADELLSGIKAATPDGDPLRTQMSFVLGEASQIPFSPETADLERKLSFLMTLGEGQIEIFISTDNPAGTFIEAMAWDAKADGFNYYRTVKGAWVFAGNSRHALEPPTERAGPFETHRSGSVIMKELRLPWVHWHSPTANIFDSALPPDDERRSHPQFTDKTDGGAYVLEPLVMASIERWTNARFAKLISSDGTFSRPQRVLEQVLDTPTVNLVSSQRESGGIEAGQPVDLPPTFFVDARALAHAPLGLPEPPPLTVDGALYLASLEEFGFHLAGFDSPGGGPRDTHFAFVGTEPAFEDFDALRKALEVGLISPRLAAALLMVDFPNPVFSAKRRKLLDHVPETAIITNGTSEFSQQMADSILAAAEGSPEGSAEAEFAERWGVGEDFQAPFTALLNSYYQALAAQLANQGGFNDCVRLAESRRRRVGEETPLVESGLLFPTIPETNIPDERLEMRPDATVVTVVGAEG